MALGAQAVKPTMNAAASSDRAINICFLIMGRCISERSGLENGFAAYESLVSSGADVSRLEDSALL
jgi:hypothetical protein